MGVSQEQTPPPPQVDAEGSGLLGGFTSCNFPPAAAFHAAPRVSSTGGHVAAPSSSAGGQQGDGVPLHTSPGQGEMASSSLEPRVLVQGLLGTGIGSGMGVAGACYGGYWGLVLVLLQAGMEVIGDCHGVCWGLVQRLLGMGTEVPGGWSSGLLSSSSLSEQLQVHGFGSHWAGFGGRSGVWKTIPALPRSQSAATQLGWSGVPSPN